MNERIATLLAGAAALFLTLWLFGGARETPPPQSRPSTQDAGDAGLLGLYRWLERGGVPVATLRGRYTSLPSVAPAEDGNLLVVALPMVWSVRPSESAALTDWVRAGNHVLVLRSAGPTFSWSRTNLDGGAIFAALGLDTDFLALKSEAPRLAERRAACNAPSLARGTITGDLRRLRTLPNTRHPIMTGVRELHVNVRSTKSNFYDAVGYAEGERYWYPLLCDPELRLPIFLGFRAGAGRVWVMDYGEAFANDNLARADNARLFANIAGLALLPSGKVIFDDMHQGYSELYDPETFYADPRLHGTLAFLLGCWLVWLLGYSRRFGRAPLGRGGARLTDFARAIGRFYARYLQPGEAARGLFRNFFNEVRARHRLPPAAEPAWDLLQRATALPPATLAQLRTMHERALRGAPIDLVLLRNLLLKVRQTLT